MLKEQKGITLVALVLAIIILLIIAGVAFATFFENRDANSGSYTVSTSNEDAKTKIKLIFEVMESNYQSDLSKGAAMNREDVFTASNILEKLEENGVTGNTVNSLGDFNIKEGVTINYNNQFIFFVTVKPTGEVIVEER